MNIALDVYSVTVANGFVLVLHAEMPCRSLVEMQVIGHQNIYIVA